MTLTLALAVSGLSIVGATAASAASQLGVAITLATAGQSTVQSREPLGYNVAVADSPSTAGVVTATLTNAQWGAATANNTQAYCQAAGGTFALSSGNSVWTCSGITFSSSLSQVTFTPLAFAPTSVPAGASIGLTVKLTTSNGTISTTATPITVKADSPAYSIVPSVAVGGGGTNVNLAGDLIAQTAVGTPALAAAPSVSYSLAAPSNAQSCTNPADSYNGPSCTAVTSVPFVDNAATLIQYPNSVDETNYDTVSPSPQSRTSSQPGGSGAQVTLTGVPKDNVYPSPTNNHSIQSNFVVTSSILSDSVKIDATWLSSLRYPAGGGQSGSYSCNWTAVSNVAAIALTKASGSCGTLKASTQETLSSSLSYGAGSYNPIIRVFPNSTLPNSFSDYFGPTGTIPASAGMVGCIKFDNSRDVLVSTVSPGNLLSAIEYGSGNWGAAATDTAHSTYEMRSANCSGTVSVPTWYTAAQVDFTNSSASGKLINANQINVVRGTTSASMPAGAVATFNFGGSIMALGTDTRGAVINTGDVHLFVPQAVTGAGVVFDNGQCAGADDSARTCPTPSGPAPIAGVPYAKQGTGPMSVEYTLNGSTANNTTSGYTFVYPGAGVTGQFLAFKINTRGFSDQSVPAHNNYQSQPVAGKPLVSVANVTTTTVFPIGVNIDCRSIVPVQTSCTKVGSGATVQYTVTWVTDSLTQGSIQTFTVPGSIDSQSPSGVQDVTTTVTAPGQTPQVDDKSILRFTTVKQNQPAITKTAATAGVLPGESDSWTLTMFTPASISVDAATGYDILPYDGDPLGSIVKGTYGLTSIDSSAASGASVYVSSTPPATLDQLDGVTDGYLNPQSSTAQANIASINAAFTCSLAQVGTAGCPADLNSITAINIQGSSAFLPAGSSKSVVLGIATDNLKRGDILDNAFATQMSNYVTMYSAVAPIAIAAPSFTVQNSVSPSSEVAPGSTATYSVTVTNTGNVALPFRTLTPTITDDISGLVDDTATPTITNLGGGTGSVSGGILSWTPPVIAPGASATLTFTAVVQSPPTGDKKLVTKVSAPQNSFAPTPTGLDCPAGSSAARCSTTTSVSSAPVFTTGAPTATATNGTAYTFTVKANGYSAPTFTVVNGNLPTGLSLNGATGVISGTPTTNGVFSFQIAASNSSPLSPTTSPVYAITVGTKPVITTASTPVATAGAPYSFTFTASGSPSPTFAVTSGTLPAGLSLNSASGLLSGTPTASGSSTYTIVASNALGSSAAKSFTTTVADVPAITTGPPPGGTTTVPYSFTVKASGSPASTFAVSTGSLPTGLTLNPGTGVISGTPTATGSFSYTITASNGAATTAQASYTTAISSAPAITSSTPPSGVTGSAYSFTITASGTPAPTFTISSGTLPTGLTLDGVSGKISGTPTAAGSYSYTVQASNTSSQVATASYTTVISSIPALTSPVPASPTTIGLPYSFTFTASGSPAPAFTITSGALPTGLVLNAVSGVLSGTPTTAGSFAFTVKADNGVGSAAQGSYTINVVSNPVITSSNPTSPATIGAPYSFSVVASGSPAPTFSITSGTLPSGLALSPSGVISGTPSAAGPSTFTIKAANGSAVPATKTYTIDVYSVPVITSSAPPTAVLGSSYSFTVKATGTPSPNAFTISAGALPDGLTLNSATGVISGTPTKTGSYSYTVSASNGGSIPATASYNTLVASVPTITSSSPTSPATVGAAYSFTVTASGSPAPMFAISAGALPEGLNLDSSSGVISGSPTSPGSSTFTVTASNESGTPNSAQYTIVTATAPVITSGAPPTGTTSVPYSFIVTASGSPAPVFAIASGALPAGLTLNTATGKITGTPTTPGQFTYTISASNGALPVATSNYTTSVVTAPSITSASPSSPATSGTAYSFTVTATGTPAPTFVISAGALPSGLALDAVTGVISGTPTATGSYPFTVQATNGAATAASAAYTIDVVSNPVITSLAPPARVTQGAAFSFTVTASGAPAPSAFTVPSGTLPTGLILNPSTGKISGAATTVGTFTFTVRASNGSAIPAEATYTMAVVSNPVITSATPPSPATVGVAYSFSVTASGTPAPAFSISSGSLPTGIALSSTGVLSGTPTGTGTYTFTVRADNGSAVPATKSYTIDVFGAPTITSAAPPTGTLGVGYSFTVTAAATPEPNSFTVTAGAMPNGLTLNPATGVITGTPSAVGTFSYTISVSNGSATPASASYTTLIASTPSITSSTPPAGTVGTPYSFTVVASGSPAPTFALASGALPDGLSLDHSTGAISGTPTSPGSFTYSISASNGSSTSAVAAYTTSVASVPHITSATPSSGVKGAPYSFTITASGSPAPKFSVSAGSLPAGLTLDSTSGVISGTPTTVGTSNYTIRASNGANTAATADYSTIVSSVPALSSGSPTSPATTGVQYQFTFTATGSPAPTFSVSGGTIPVGLTLDPVTGVLSGTPTTAGAFSFTISADNGVGSAAQSSYTLLVTSNPVITSPAPTSHATVGSRYSFTMTASGSPEPLFTVKSGSLPAGLTLSSTGVISGTPTAAGASTFTVEADNGSAVPATATYTVTSFTVPTVTSAAPPIGTVGAPYSHTVTASGDPEPSAFSVVSGALPTGLSLDSATGEISGVPTAVGSYRYTVAASNGGPTAGTASYTTLVASVPAITSEAPTSPATVGVPYSFVVTASGSPEPTFTVSSGALPAGLSLDAVTGKISGVPTDSGESTFTVTAANSANAAASADYTILTATIPVIISSGPGLAKINQPFSFIVVASGSPAPVFTLTSGVLPTGVTLDSKTGVISGTPTVSGVFPITITADNGASSSASEHYSLSVAPAPVVSSPVTKPRSSKTTGGVSTASAQGALVKVIVRSTDRRVEAGTSIGFSIEGFDANGDSLGDVTSHVRLSTSSPSDSVSGNHITFTVAGSHIVSAQIDGVQATTKIIVTPNYAKPKPGGLFMRLSDQSVRAGTTVGVTISGEDIYGNSYGDLRPRTQLSTNNEDDRVSSDQSGVTVREPGKTVITAEVLGEKLIHSVVVTHDTDFGWLWWLLLLVPAIALVVWILSRRREER